MKVLTIKEPWASLIVNGYKQYEFRSWKTNYRGKILIHAGMSFEKNVADRFLSYNIQYNMGHIIGEAEIVDCIKVDDNFNKELIKLNPVVYARSNHVESYAWKLVNIKKYDEPIKCKGKLGLWNYNGSINIERHEMRLNSAPFDLIKKGTKTIEMRLNDEKRKLIKVGDIIEFTNRETNERICVDVIKLHYFNNFEDLYDKFDKTCLGYGTDEIKNPKDMQKYYSIDEQEKYGVVGIELRIHS